MVCRQEKSRQGGFGQMKRVLGKGLEALIPGAGAGEEEKVVTEIPGLNVIREIPLAKIRPSPFQPRLKFDEAGLSELARSIETRGGIQPGGVRAAHDSHELADGGRERSRVPNAVRLLTLPAEMLQMLYAGSLTAGRARSQLAVPNDAEKI